MRSSISAQRLDGETDASTGPVRAAARTGPVDVRVWRRAPRVVLGSGLVALGRRVGGLGGGTLGGVLVGLLTLDASLGLGLGELGLEGLRGDGLRHVDDQRLRIGDERGA